MTALAVPLITPPSNIAHADYSRPFDPGFTNNDGYHSTGYFDIPDNALFIRFNYITADKSINRIQVQPGNNIYVVNSYPYELNVSQFAGQSKYLRCYHVDGNTPTGSTISDYSCEWVLSGSDPDLGAKSQEQRYNTTTFRSSDFTKSNSLPLIYTDSLRLSDFTPNGNCNSIQVDASTVGGDRLEWRLNLGQSGVDGQTAWLPIGFKMPLQVNEFNEHSIQLRMADPDNPGQYYDLQPSELSLCSVTYGYTADVYMSLQPGEYQELPTAEMPTMPNYELPTMPNVSEYVQAPISVVSTVFNWLMNLPHIAVLVGVLAFAFIIRVIIW